MSRALPAKRAIATLEIPPAPSPIVEAKQRKRPDFSGVPGELCDLPADLPWGVSGRTSPYNPLLDQLTVATEKWNAGEKKTPQPGLCFGSIKARAAVGAQGKKRGLKLSFVEAGGKLYVRLDSTAAGDKKSARRTTILQSLRIHGSQNAIQLSAKLRAAGDASIDAGGVEAICVQMSRDGLIYRGEGDVWAPNPVKKAAPVGGTK